jgi:uncharacterized protein YciI
MASEFVYVVRPTRPEMLSSGKTEIEDEVIGRHFRYVQALVQEGRALLVGRTLTEDEGTFGLVIFRADDLASAFALAEADPAVVHGVMRVEVYPFRVVLLSSTWSTS